MTKGPALVLVAVAIFGFAKFNDLCYFLFVVDHLLQSLDDATRGSPDSQGVTCAAITNKPSSQEHKSKVCKKEFVLEQDPTDMSNSPTDTEMDDRNDEEEDLSDCTTVVDESSPAEKQAPILKTKKTRRSRRRRRRRSPKNATTTESNNDEPIDFPTTDLNSTSKLDIDLELPEIRLPLDMSLYSPTATSHFPSLHLEAPSAPSESLTKPKLTLQTSNFACAPIASPSHSLSPIPSALSSFSTAAPSCLFEPSSSGSSVRAAPYSAFPTRSPVISRPHTPFIFNHQQPLSAIDSFSPFNSPVVTHKVTKSTLPWSVPAHMTSIAHA